MSLPEFIDRSVLAREVRAALDLAAGRTSTGRVMIGIAGPPGAGKSTLTAALREAINAEAGDGTAAIVPMDGFHLRNAVLVERGIRHRKGAPDTFDARGFVEMLKRARAGEAPLPIPTFDHGKGDPVPGGVVLTAATRIALVEGNYLYLSGDDWGEIAPLLDRRLFLEVDRDECRRRLVPRHIKSGKAEDHARRHVESVDLPNHDLIRAALDRTSVIVIENG